MVHKAPLQLLIILLVLSCVLTSLAVPATRYAGSLSTQTTLAQGYVGFRNEQSIDVGKDLIAGRMDLENAADYPGAGANNRHDPRTPGTP